MTPRTLFIIILRVLGILLFKELFIAVPQLIYAFLSFSSEYNAGGGIMLLLLSLLYTAVVLWLSYILIFKPDMVVTKFGLDKGFDQEFLQLNVNTASVLRIALIITGGLILIPEIPEFCRSFYNIWMQRTISLMADGSPDWSPVIVSGVKILLGLLLIGERKRVLEFLLRSPDEKNGADQERVNADRTEP